MKFTLTMRKYDDLVACWYLAFNRWRNDTRIAVWNHPQNMKMFDSDLKEIREQLWAVREGLAD